jgi:probable phosphomutase (TIGR03848 family)
MTTVLLIRHGQTDAAGVVLAGRAAGVHLNDAGRRQSHQLPARLDQVLPRAIYCSPLDRAMETAAPLAAACDVLVQVRPQFIEVDFGEWTGRRIDSLVNDPVFQQFNTYRSATRIPGGETMLDVQRRVVGDLEILRRLHDGEIVAVVTHGDVIRAALAHYAGIPIDLCLRIDVMPASISAIGLDDRQAVLRLVNGMGPVPRENLMTA